MFYRSSEVHDRNAYIERTITNTLEVLGTSDVSKRLGEHAVILTDVIENQLYPASIRHGKIIAPRSLDDERIPVVALKDGERLRLDARLQRQTPAQVAISEAFITALPDNKKFLRQFNRHDRSSRLPYRNFLFGSSLVHGRDDARAYVMSSSFTLPGFASSNASADNFKPNFMTRPYMAFVVDGEESHKSPDVLVHESQHVFDFMRETVFSKGDAECNLRQSLRHELRGYYVQSLCIEGMVLAGYTPGPDEHPLYTIDADGKTFSSIAHTITHAMNENPSESDDIFMPSDALVEKLQLIGIGTIEG